MRPLCRYHQQDFGWWRILTVSGGFVAHTPDPAQLQVCVALYNHLPVALPLKSATATLIDSNGIWTQGLSLGPGPQQHTSAGQGQQHQQPVAAAEEQTGFSAKGLVQQQAAIADGIQGLQLSAGQPQQQASATWPTQLQPRSWHLFHALVTPRCVGSTAVDQLLLQLSENCSVNFLLSSFPPGRPALGRPCLPSGEEPFGVQQGLKQGVWVTKVQHVGPLPDVQVGRVYHKGLTGCRLRLLVIYAAALHQISTGRISTRA